MCLELKIEYIREEVKNEIRFMKFCETFMKKQKRKVIKTNLFSHKHSRVHLSKKSTKRKNSEF